MAGAKSGQGWHLLVLKLDTSGAYIYVLHMARYLEFEVRNLCPVLC
jgi:hypothetical protein